MNELERAVRDEHSIKRHPLRPLLSNEEWEQLRLDVQLCRISWPVGLEIISDPINPEPDR